MHPVDIPSGRPLRLAAKYISYSHKDADLCAALKSSLVGFEREGRAAFWSDHAIDAGDKWYAQIMAQLEAADIAILLLSREFYASEFVWKEELPRARQRWEEGKLTVVSVRLRDCYNPKVDEYKWLRDVQQVPRDGRVVDGGNRAKRDAAWAEGTREIDRTIDKVLQRRDSGIESSGEVDAALADTPQAVTRALEIARQINADAIGPVHKALSGYYVGVEARTRHGLLSRMGEGGETECVSGRGKLGLEHRCISAYDPAKEPVVSGLGCETLPPGDGGHGPARTKGRRPLVAHEPIPVWPRVCR